MRNLLCALQSVSILVLVLPAVAQNQDVAASLALACDRAAASPSDTNRPVGIAGVPSDKLDAQIAIAACKAAAAVAPGDSRTMFQLGRAHAAAKAYEDARVQFSRASDLGYAAAQVSLGTFYAAGRGGLSRDDREALRLYKLAAEQGDALGNSSLGFFYESGRGGLPKDDGEAARFYKLAADKGEAWGQYNLGRFYQNGRGGLTQNDREAARLYRLAADQSHELAEVSLGFLYETGRGGLPKDDREAVVYYRRAAEQGNAAGRNNLGRFYLNGRGGLPQSDQEAARLYRLAAEQGHVFAQINLGFLYEAGRGGLAQDDIEASRLYRQAAERGEPIAQNKLATFYEEGRGGLPKDSREAARLYKLAAEQDRNANAKRVAREALTRLEIAPAGASPSASSGVRSAIPVIGFLDTTAPSANTSGINGFRSALKEAGFVEGKNVAIDFRWSSNPREMYDLATDLVRRHVDLIVASGSGLAAQAAKAATDTVPIVIMGGTDPVTAGLVPGLNRPGGNVTGVTSLHNQLAGKRLGLLLDLVPNATVVGYLVGFNGSADPQTKDLLDAARSVGRQVVVIECRGIADFDAAFETLSQRQVGGLIVSAFPLAFNNRRKVLALAARYKIPTIYSQNRYAFEGGLMSYMGIISESYVVNQYVARILKGTKPADLPIQMPSKFELILNLRTAKALGLSVPPTILVTADKVIE